jgi:hypothetical protein
MKSSAHLAIDNLHDGMLTAPRATCPGRCARPIALLCLLAVCVPVSAQDIIVRLIDARSGKPLSKVYVAMSSWNGTFDIHKPPYPKRETAEGKTDTEGKIVFHFPPPAPEHIGFSVGNPRDFAGCWRLRDFSLDAVIRSGVVAEYNESKCGKKKTEVTAKPGEVVIVEKRLTLGQQMRQEIP